MITIFNNNNNNNNNNNKNNNIKNIKIKLLNSGKIYQLQRQSWKDWGRIESWQRKERKTENYCQKNVEQFHLLNLLAIIYGKEGVTTMKVEEELH